MKCIRIYGHSDGNTFKVAHLVHESEDTIMQLDDWNTITQILKLRFQSQPVPPSGHGFPYTFTFPFGVRKRNRFPMGFPYKFDGVGTNTFTMGFPYKFGSHENKFPFKFPTEFEDNE